ncbi:MAG: lysophospholipid acyltransferase family protein [Halothiobacillaceae bacterium]
MRWANDLRAASRILKLAAHLILGVVWTLYYRNASAKRRDEVIRRWLAGVGRILNLHVERAGQNPCASALWAVNHVSWLDIPLLGGLHPGARFLSKAEVAGWPLIGWLARHAGTLFIRRGAGMAEAQQAMTDALLAGKTVVLFPEATTTDGRQVRRFFPRLFASAAGARLAVQPVTIRYVDEQGCRDPRIAYIDDMTLWQSLWQIARVPQPRVHLEFSPPFCVPQSRTDAARLAESAVREVLEQPTRPLREQEP